MGEVIVTSSFFEKGRSPIAGCNDIDPLPLCFLNVVSRVTSVSCVRPRKHGLREWVNCNDYRYSERGGEKKMDFKEFLMSAPDLSVLDLERPREVPRDVEL